ncbi:hypothetical protein ABPG72_020947 [Tetrahymena utriculariae]
MEFVSQRNQILALTTQAVIYVDPYTLEYIETVLQSGFTFNGMSRLKGLNYVIVYDILHVYVIEIVAGQVITMIDFWAHQSFGFIQSANFLSLQSGQIFVVVFSSAYPFIWSIDVEKNQVTFKGSFSNDLLFLEKESIVDGGVDTNFKQEKEGKFMTMIEKDMISLSDKTIPSNNKIPHKINFTSQQNNDEDML